MIVGTVIVTASFYFYFVGGAKYAPGECNNQPSNLFVGGIVYASYLYLFVEFAVGRFWRLSQNPSLSMESRLITKGEVEYPTRRNLKEKSPKKKRKAVVVD
jgi:hypothetical protein